MCCGTVTEPSGHSSTANSTVWRTLPVLRCRSQYKEHCQCFRNIARRSTTVWWALQCRNQALLYLSEKERLDSRHNRGMHRYPATDHIGSGDRQQGFGVQKWQGCVGFIVCMVAYTPRLCFWSHWHWWPHHTSSVPWERSLLGLGSMAVAAGFPLRCSVNIQVWNIPQVIVQELCESRGGRPGLSILTSLLVSVDIKL